MERWEMVADGRFWLGEKALEVCSEVMLKDLIARDLKGRQKQQKPASNLLRNGTRKRSGNC